ncbi:MAG: inositol 2-dehydrogenase, partial [Deinococcota bacterium]
MKKIALIGAGNIGKTHARNMVAHQHCHLTHIYDLNPQAAAQLAASVGAKAVLSPEDIWNADIDAVMVASSTATHADFLEQAIRFGKPVYLEKPIDLDIKRVKDVVQLAHENPVPVLVGFSRRFDTNHLAVQQAVQSGEIGQLEMVLMTARDPTPPPLAYIKTSGGQLRDQAIHFFDLACWIANQTPLEVYATGSALVDASIGAVGDVDTSMLILKMPSGALVHLDLSRRTGYGYDERIEAFGSLGMIESGRKPTGQVRRYKADKQISSG